MLVDDKLFLVTIGCGQLPKIVEVTAQHDFAVFGTLDGQILSNLMKNLQGRQGLPVYFYESG
ncbi:MAG: hypothetical protein AB1374_11265 [Bacillota bacterium]